MDDPTTQMDIPLEQRVNQPPRNILQRAASTAWNTIRSKPYWVDVTASWLLYTPPYALMEWQRGGMDQGEVVQNRVEGLAVQAATMLPYRRVREWLAAQTGVTPESPKVRKWLVDTGAVFAMQVPLYAGMLAVTGVSREEFMYAYPAGLGLGAVLHPIFGYAVDRWRKLLGAEPTLYR